MNPVIAEIIVNPKYEDLCKRVANWEDRWKDLYQMFREKVIDPKNEKVILNSNKLDNYLCGIIFHLWNDKKHVKTQTLATSDLYDIRDGGIDRSDYLNEKFVHEPSQAEKEVRIRLVEELSFLLKSPDEKTRRQAELLKRFCNGENRLEISKQLGINYKIVYEEIEEAKLKIRQRINMNKQPVTKTEINITLRNEGCKASYSGKTKTFYVSQMPKEDTLKAVQKAGFKVEKK